MTPKALPEPAPQTEIPELKKRRLISEGWPAESIEDYEAEDLLCGDFDRICETKIAPLATRQRPGGSIPLGRDSVAKRIALTRGLFAVVDDSDFESLARHRWYAIIRVHTPYAARSVRSGGKKSMILMHRHLMGLLAGDSRQVDHVNSDGLDNRRTNLRIATSQHNHYNFQARSGSSTFKGVSWNKRAGKWLASIGYEKRRRFLGYFDQEADAALAYDEAARLLHGEFARFNFPERQL